MGLNLYIKYMTWDHEKVINESELGIHISTGAYLTGFYKFGSAYAKFRKIKLFLILMIRVLGSNNIAGKKVFFTDYCVNKYNLLLEVNIVKFKTSLR